MRPRPWVILALVTACFDPTLGQQPFACGAQGECPPGYLCDGDQVCRRTPTTDAPRDPPDAGDPPDARFALCAPGSFLRCEDEVTAVMCNDAGNAETQADCSACDATARQCWPCDRTRAEQCVGDDQLVRCDTSGQVTDRTTCAGFCDPNGGGAGVPACAVLEASNLPSGLCDGSGVGVASLRASADATIDLTSCPGTVIAQSGSGSPAPPSLCLLTYDDFIIDAGVKLRFTGPYAVAVLVLDTLQIDGELDVGAVGEIDGPGVVQGPPGQGGVMNGAWTTGGGGAGHGTDGKPGVKEDGANGGAQGKMYGTTNLVPLRAGSRGGAAGDRTSLCTGSCPLLAWGGGGGGALQLVACKHLRLGPEAHVDAGGGGGGGGFGTLLFVEAGGGGGGGSGGALLLEAPRVTVPLAAAVTGGGGGGGGGGQPGGAGTPGHDGSDGHLSTDPAPGGAGGSSFAGPGGMGGSRSSSWNNLGVLPTNGQRAASAGYGAGGGGAAAGRIRINTRAATPPAVRGVVCPMPSTGAVGQH